MTTLRNGAAALTLTAAVLTGAAAPAFATDAAPLAASASTTAPASQPAQEQERDEDNGDWGLWGLAGLLGLAGLAGLKRREVQPVRHETHHVDTARHTGNGHVDNAAQNLRDTDRR